MNRWILALILVGSSLHAQEEVDLDPHPQAIKTKPSSWKANVFVGSALLAFAAGIVIICLDGGTSNGATYRLNHPEANQ